MHHFNVKGFYDGRKNMSIHMMKLPLIIMLAIFQVPVYVSADETAQALYEQGMNYMSSGDQEKAIESLRKAVKLNPNIPQLRNALGVALLDKTGNLKLAKEEFEAATKLNPSYGEPFFNMGTYYAGTGKDPVLATEYFQKAVQADPSFAKAYMGLGWISLERKDAKKAVESFEKAVELHPTFPEAQYGLAVAYTGMKKNELALKPITALREIGRYDLAQAVEAVIQENQKKLEAPPATTSTAGAGKAQSAAGGSSEKKGGFLGF